MTQSNENLSEDVSNTQAQPFEDLGEGDGGSIGEEEGDDGSNGERRWSYFIEIQKT